MAFLVITHLPKANIQPTLHFLIILHFFARINVVQPHFFARINVVQLHFFVHKNVILSVNQFNYIFRKEDMLLRDLGIIRGLMLQKQNIFANNYFCKK